MEQILQDKDLTMSEKGLMCYLILNKERVYKTKLSGLFGNDGIKKISRTFDSLCKKGYIETTEDVLCFNYKIHNLCQEKTFKTVKDIRINRRKK